MTDTLVDARSVAPGDLIIAANVRSDTKVDKTFIASIKQHGVLVPILAEPGEGDTLEVVDGQRRVLAAIEAGLPTVPVLVTTDREDAQRIIEQLVVNDHRAELTDSEHTAAYQQLSLFGISADAIARKTNAPRKRVETAITVAASPVAAQALAEQPITLDQAAIIVEFEDNETDVAALIEAAGTGHIDHVAARIRDRREQERVLEEAERAAIADGWRVVPRPEYDDPKVQRISYLYTSEKRTKYISPEDHKDCPGRAVFITLQQSWKQDRYVPTPVLHEVCENFTEHGHFASDTSKSSGSASGGGLSDEEKARRRETRENNKLWGPATAVRREFIRELLQRKELPANWELFVAQFNARGQHEHNYTFEMSLLAPSEPGAQLKVAAPLRSAAWLKANPTRAAHYLIAAALASVEGAHDFGKDGWRHDLAPAHLKQLSAWGYTLSELEESVAKKAGK